MKMNERKTGIILSYIGQAIKILVNLIYTPVMLRLLGQSEYGLYQLVFSVVSYLSLLSLGFGSSYLRFYSRYKVKDDTDEIARLNGMFMTIFTTISVICIFCGILMIANIQQIFGTGLSYSEYKTARVLMALMVFNLALTFPNSVFNCAITAHEKYIFQKSLVILENICSPFLSIPLLIMGYGSIGMVLVTTILTVAIFISNIYFCLKKINMRFIFKGFQFSLLKEMWIFTFFIFLNQIIDQINWSVDKFLLGRFRGTVAVAVYGIGGQINSMYLQFSTTISSVFIPKVNQIVAESDDNHELTNLFIRVGRVQFIVIMLILSGFIFFGQVFIGMWAGNGYSDSYAIALLLIGPITVPLIQNLGIEIQRAKNKHKTRSIVYFFIAVINVLLSIPLIKLYGAIGAALGTAISLILGNIIFMNWYYHNRIGIDIIEFWISIFKIFPALIFPILFGIMIKKFFELNNIMIFVVAIVAYTFVYVCSMWLFGLNVEEKNMIKAPIIRFMTKHRRM